MTTKYGGNIDFDVYRQYAIKNIFKLLPLKEEDKNWEKYLDGLLVEFNGLDLLCKEVGMIAVIAKLEGLYSVENHELFRKVVFDSIDLMKKIYP